MINNLWLLVRQLEMHARLSVEDGAAILSLPSTERRLARSSYLVREGEVATTCSLLISGIVYRQKLTGIGARQILSINFRGEAIDFQNVFLGNADHDVRALTSVVVATIPRAPLLSLMKARPGIAHAVLMSVLIEASVFREWIVNVGRRGGEVRVAHFLCEYAWRMDALGLEKNGYELPVTQEQIGDATGLTAVHVNRMLGLLEEKKLIRRERHRFHILDLTGLHEAGDFNSAYLHGQTILGDV